MYSTVDMIDKFRHDNIFSSTGRERDVIMKPYSKEERANMDTSSELFALYFYVHLHIIYDLWVFIQFTSFEMDFLTTIKLPLLNYPKHVGHTQWFSDSLL